MAPETPSDDTLGQTLAAISDGSRRAILLRLTEGEARMTDLAAPFPMSLAGVSKHVKVLEEAGLVRRRIKGREHWLTLELGPLDEASAWIERTRRFWDKRLRSLHAFLKRKGGNKKGGKVA